MSGTKIVMLPKLPEPAAYAPQMITEDAYTLEQVIVYGRAIAEACAKMCEQLAAADERDWHSLVCADAIREAAKQIGATSAPPQSPEPHRH